MAFLLSCFSPLRSPICAPAHFSALVFDVPSQQPVMTTIEVKVGPSAHGCPRMRDSRIKKQLQLAQSEPSLKDSPGWSVPRGRVNIKPNVHSGSISRWPLDHAYRGQPRPPLGVVSQHAALFLRRPPPQWISFETPKQLRTQHRLECGRNFLVDCRRVEHAGAE